ncbi:transferase family-domain-containing protein [Aspergillus stella-maris]|uniref:transferase family-domain-containing protein n=1 Tax=Aspergillus stella-maris TaxID=1810926 RepID=UPI003CCD8995
MSSISPKTFVRPAFPLVPGTGHLTPLDQYMIRVVLPILCIFETDPAAARNTIIDSLKTGLSSTLVELDFLAADIVPCSPGGEDDFIQLEYSNDAGVWFYTADAPNVSFSDLAARHFPLGALPVEQFMPPGSLAHSETRSPALSVQTTFITGGLVLGFCIHHSVVDGPAIGNFLEIWARHTAAAADGCIVATGGSSSDTVRNTYDFGTPAPDYTLADCYPGSLGAPLSLQKRIMDLAVAGDHQGLAKALQYTHWRLSKESLDRLRQVAAPPSPGLPSVTDNNAISVLVWMSLSRARIGLSQMGCSASASLSAPTSSLYTAVNVRTRMDPPLPDDFPGNAIVMARAAAPATKLQDNTSAPGGTLYELATKVSESVASWAPDRIWRLTRAIQANSAVANGLVPPLGHDLVTTSPAQMVDMLARCEWGGGLGVARGLRWAFPAFADGFAVLVPALDGGMEIQLWAGQEACERLRGDGEWTGWVDLVE